MGDEIEGHHACFAGGKVILLGEHAVVYGHPALAAGLSIGVRVTSRLANAAVRSPMLKIDPWGLQVTEGQDSDLSRAFEALLDSYANAARKHLSKRSFHADVALPAGAGLGCSAAVGVALVRAFDRVLAEADTSAHPLPSDTEVAERSLAWERIFHGQPSGVDSAMATAGGLALFRKGHELAPISARRLWLVIGHSGESSSTKDLVRSVARQRSHNRSRVDGTFEAIEALVHNARLTLIDHDLKALGQLMDLNQALLGSLLLSTTALEEICSAAREAGAHGAKLTGSGGGGCAVALCEGPAAAAEVRDAVKAAGYDAFCAQAG